MNDNESCVQMRYQDCIDQGEDQDHYQHEIAGYMAPAPTDCHALILPACRTAHETPAFNLIRRLLLTFRAGYDC